MQRIEERIGAVFEGGRLPDRLTCPQFCALAGIDDAELSFLIGSGAVEADEAGTVAAKAYLRFAFERNLEEADVRRELIDHVLASLSWI